MKLWTYLGLCLLGIGHLGCSSEKGASYFQNYRSDSRLSDVVLRHAEIALKSENYYPHVELNFEANLSLGLIQRDDHTGLEEVLPIKQGEFYVEAVLYESEMGSPTSSKRIAQSERIKTHAQLGMIRVNPLTMRVFRMPEADFTRPQASRSVWELHFRVVPVETTKGLSPAEGYFSYYPGKGASQVVNSPLGTFEKTRSHLSAILPSTPAQRSLEESFSPSLLAKELHYRFLGREFSIDRYLNLRQTRGYSVTLTPHWYYPYVFQSGGSVSATVRPGTEVSLSFLFVAQGVGLGRPDELPTKRFLNRYETTSVVDANGQLRVTVPLVVDFHEEPYLDSGVEVLIEMSPKNGGSVTSESRGIMGFTPRVASQLFESRKVVGSAMMNPLPFSMQDFEKSLLLPPVEGETSEFHARSSQGKIVKPLSSEKISPYEVFLKKAQSQIGEITTQLLTDDFLENHGEERLLGKSWREWYEAILEGYQKTLSRKSCLSESDETATETRRSPFQKTEIMPAIRCHQRQNPISGNLDFVLKGGGAAISSFLNVASRSTDVGQDTDQEKFAAPTPSQDFEVTEILFLEDLPFPRLSPPILQDIQWQMSVSFFNEVAEFERSVGAKQTISSWEGGASAYVNIGGGIEGSTGLTLFGNGVTGKLFANAGVDARYGWFYRDQEVNIEETGVMTDRRERVTFSESTPFYGEQRTFSFDAVVRRCLLIQEKAQDTGSENSYLICAVRPERLRESWFYLADFDFRHELPVERRDLRERMLIKLIRGQKNYEVFKELMSSGPRNFSVKNVQPLRHGVTPIVRDTLEHHDKSHRYFKHNEENLPADLPK